MSSNDPAISVRGLSKAYTIARGAEGHTTLAEAVRAWARNPFRRNATETLWALRDVSFDVKKGEVVGIIGRNGAGKSTLLKVLSRITEPTTGGADLRGRVGSLLEVGTGFHQELTGRENIFLNGAILGMTRAEIRRQFDAIVDFAGVERFLDTPVKRYSSGMYVRLAFAVAAHLDLNILMVDEVLSVGDAEFQRRCVGKIGEVAHSGRTVLFVSHNMGLISQLCGTGLYLSQGQIGAIGQMPDVVRCYIEREVRAAEAGSLKLARRTHHHDEGLTFTSAGVVDEEHNPCVEVDVRRPFAIRVGYEVSSAVRNVELSVRVCAVDGRAVFTSHESDCAPHRVRLRTPGAYAADVEVPAQFLMPGDYVIDLLAHEPNVRMLDHHEQAMSFSVLETGSKAARYNRHQYLGMVLVDLPWTTASGHGAGDGATGSVDAAAVVATGGRSA